MNTPATIKRWTHRTQTLPAGEYVNSLQNPQHAYLLARITSEFVHLESMMPIVLAVLAGCSEQSAGFILRAVMSPRGRIGMMLGLLEGSPANVNLGREYDDLIKEFSSINGCRNNYVHGQWFTTQDVNQKVYLAVADPDGFGFLQARPVEAKEMDELIVRIGGLVGRIIKGPAQDLARQGRRQHIKRKL